MYKADPKYSEMEIFGKYKNKSKVENNSLGFSEYIHVEQLTKLLRGNMI